MKIRTESGKYPNGKDKKYTDETGKLWSGSICPPCNKIRANETMKKKRNEKISI